MSECKHHYKICGRCQNPLVCNVCGKNRGQIYEKRIAELKQQLAALRDAFDRLISVAEQCDGWEFFPSEELDAALANNTLFFQEKKNITQRIDRLNT